MNYIRNINKYLYILVFALVSTVVGYAQSVNAGGNYTTCGTEYTLQGSTDAGDTNGITWSLESKPAGATDPIISNPSILTPTVTGMNKPGPYVFKLTKVNAGGSTTAPSRVTITSSGDVSSFSAGSDILNIPATVGTVNLNGVIPEGFTGVWTAQNNFEWSRFGRKNSNNATLSNPNIANPTFSLTKKADHDADPAYTLTLKITSVYNSNCSYVKSIIVRFVPNPVIRLKDFSGCAYKLLDNDVYVKYQDDSPRIASGYNGTTGFPNSGTAITLNVISQPTGGNLSIASFETSTVFFKSNAPGIYKYSLTFTNSAGTYTTDVYTINISGVVPGRMNFIDPNHPEQNMEYAGGGSGGEVHCDLVGKSTPVTIYYSIDPKDDPLLITNTISVGGIIPTGGAPTLQMLGAGQRNRSIVVTPPIGGWHIGTYAISVSTNNGGCGINATYYIHISDSSREDVSVEDIVVCYPGSGMVDAVVNLPKVYQKVVDPSYLQGYFGQYFFTLISKPEGALDPTYQTSDDRHFSKTSTIISGLNKPGEYIFKIKIGGWITPLEWVINQEFACSGASMEGTFKVIVSEQVGSNAGSDQDDLFCRARTVLVGNNPGAGQGKWTVESAPAGMAPTFSDDTNPRSIVAGLDVTGSYKFRWTITTGDCISSSIVEVITDQDNCKKPLIITNPTTTSKTIKRKK